MANQWYPHYPGDYQRDTAHLSLMEHGAYRLLLDHYYSTGGPLGSDAERLYRVCSASNQDEREAVDVILHQFFVLRDGRYHNGRADRQLVEMTEKRAKLSEKRAPRRWPALGFLC